MGNKVQGNLRGYTHILGYCIFSASYASNPHLAHGEGKMHLIGVEGSVSRQVRISRPKACHDAWRGTKLAGADHDWNGVAFPIGG